MRDNYELMKKKQKEDHDANIKAVNEANVKYQKEMEEYN